MDLGLLVLPVFREGGTDDLESRMRVRPLDGDNPVAHLEFLLRARQVVRIDPPEWFNVLEYLIVMVGQLDTMSDDVVPPTRRSPTTMPRPHRAVFPTRTLRIIPNDVREGSHIICPDNFCLRFLVLLLNNFSRPHPFLCLLIPHPNFSKGLLGGLLAQ